MEQENEGKAIVQCKACKKECKNVLTHLSMKKSCKDFYGLEYDDIKENSKKEKLAKMKKYNKDHPERVNIHKKKYKEANPDRVKAQKQKYKEENPDRVKAQRQKYKENNKEKVKLQKKKYIDNNPQRIKENFQKRKVKKREAELDSLRNTLLGRGEPADEIIKDMLDREEVCEACNESFGYNCFLYHVIGSVKCYNFYGEERYNKMKKEFKEVSQKKYKNEMNKYDASLIAKEYQQICEGCKLIFNPDAIYKHISHSKKCIEAHDGRWKGILQERKEDRRQINNADYYDRNKEELKEKRRLCYKDFKNDEDKKHAEWVKSWQTKNMESFIKNPFWQTRDRVKISEKLYNNVHLKNIEAFEEKIKQRKKLDNCNFGAIELSIEKIKQDMKNFVKTIENEIDTKAKNIVDGMTLERFKTYEHYEVERKLNMYESEKFSEFFKETILDQILEIAKALDVSIDCPHCSTKFNITCSRCQIWLNEKKSNYDMKRKPINFTLSSDEEDDEYKINIKITGAKRALPKRVCKNVDEIETSKL